MSFFTRITALATLSATLSSAWAAPSLISRQAVGGSEQTGWTNLPEVEGADVRTDWEMLGHTFPLYVSSNTEQDPAAIKRAVIMLPGKGRDCWYYWGLTDSALKSSEVPNESVSTMGPCFLTDMDQAAGAAVDGNVLFGKTTWASGHGSTLPEGADISAYSVMDELVNYYLDTNRFPNMEAVVVASHSLGAQMVQRYAALRQSTDGDDKIHYWVANPGSFMWLVEDRPAPDEACEGVDKFKYGLTEGFPKYALSDANAIGRDGIVQRYLGRKVHYAQGLADDGPGDTRCQAVTQGASHLERGRNFISTLDTLGGMPAQQTIDYIEGVSHQADRMVTSPQGLEKLFSYL